MEAVNPLGVREHLWLHLSHNVKRKSWKSYDAAIILEHQISLFRRLLTCWVKAEFPPGIGKFDGAMGRWSSGEPVFILLSVNE